MKGPTSHNWISQIVGFMIGSKGTKKASIEQETGAKITVKSQSRKATEQANITIRGSSAEVIENAMIRINLVIEDALASNRYLRFIFPISVEDTAHFVFCSQSEP